MPLIRFLARLLILIAGAVIGLGLFLFALVAFAVIVIRSLLTGKRPSMQFRMNKNPWAQRRPPADNPDDVVDIEVREVNDAPTEPSTPPAALPRPEQGTRH